MHALTNAKLSRVSADYYVVFLRYASRLFLFFFSFRKMQIFHSRRNTILRAFINIFIEKIVHFDITWMIIVLFQWLYFNLIFIIIIFVYFPLRIKIYQYLSFIKTRIYYIYIMSPIFISKLALVFYYFLIKNLAKLILVCRLLWMEIKCRDTVVIRYRETFSQRFRSAFSLPLAIARLCRVRDGAFKWCVYIYVHTYISIYI